MRPLTLAAALASLMVLATPAHADALIDLRSFKAPPVEMRHIRQPTVRWLIDPDATRHCDQVTDKDGAVKHAGGCVYWKTQPGICTVVTTNHTTHSVLGHLLLSCLKGG